MARTLDFQVVGAEMSTTGSTPRAGCARWPGRGAELVTQARFRDGYCTPGGRCGQVRPVVDTGGGGLGPGWSSICPWSLYRWPLTRPASCQALTVPVDTPRAEAISGRVSRPVSRSRCSGWVAGSCGRCCHASCRGVGQVDPRGPVIGRWRAGRLQRGSQCVTCAARLFPFTAVADRTPARHSHPGDTGSLHHRIRPLLRRTARLHGLAAEGVWCPTGWIRPRECRNPGAFAPATEVASGRLGWLRRNGPRQAADHGT
jgi:hypothetical protein